MKYFIYPAVILTVSLSISLAAAQNKVVVIPLDRSEPKVEVPVVTSAGQIWMALNLGASQVATSSDDPAAYGTLYQWGRLGDGHEYRSSSTTDVLSNTDVPGHGRFILAPSLPGDWRFPQNSNLWQGAAGTNNPCPSGFRLPTASEWEAELGSWGTRNSAGAYNSPLKLVLAGLRSNHGGTLYYAGSGGYYWSSTVDGSGSSRYLYFDITPDYAVMYNNFRANGFSVRCLKD